MTELIKPFDNLLDILNGPIPKIKNERIDAIYKKYARFLKKLKQFEKNN